MTVGEIIKELAKLPANTPVFYEDNEQGPTGVKKAKVTKLRGGYYLEEFDEDSDDEINANEKDAWIDAVLFVGYD